QSPFGPGYLCEREGLAGKDRLKLRGDRNKGPFLWSSLKPDFLSFFRRFLGGPFIGFSPFCLSLVFYFPGLVFTLRISSSAPTPEVSFRKFPRLPAAWRISSPCPGWISWFPLGQFS